MDYISTMSMSSYVSPVCEQMQCQTHTYKGAVFEVFGGMLHTEHSRGTVTTMLLSFNFCVYCFVDHFQTLLCYTNYDVWDLIVNILFLLHKPHK